jgi:hypothetical protein
MFIDSTYAQRKVTDPFRRKMWSDKANLTWSVGRAIFQLHCRPREGHQSTLSVRAGTATECRLQSMYYNNSVTLVLDRTVRTERRRLYAKLVPTFVSATDPYGRNLGFLDRDRYYFFQASPQLYSRGWEDPVPDPLLLRKSGSAGNRTRTSGSVTLTTRPQRRLFRSK